MNTSPTVQEISVKEITKSILVDLQKLSDYSGEPMAAVYVDNLLRQMRLLRDNWPFDPKTEILMALHDALVFQNRWLDYNTSQYQGVYNLFASLVNQETLTNDAVESAILTLENLGLDTLPFGVEFDSSVDENETSS